MYTCTIIGRTHLQPGTPSARAPAAPAMRPQKDKSRRRAHGVCTVCAFGLLGLVALGGSLASLRRERFRAFMAWHIAWHTSIPFVATAWLYVLTT